MNSSSASGPGAFEVSRVLKRHFTLLDARAVLRSPDVEHLAEEHGDHDQLEAGERVLVLTTLTKGNDMVYAQINGGGWFLAQSGDRVFMEIIEDETEFEEEGKKTDSTTNFCTQPPLDWLGGLMGFSSTQKETEENAEKRHFLETFSSAKMHQKQQKKLLAEHI